MRKEKIELGKLVIDPKLVEIRPINTHFVSRYGQAYRTGAKFPLPIVEEGTLRITSGNHRVMAMLQEYGPDRKVNVMVNKYASEREVLECFVKENAVHGNALDGITRKRMTIALIDEGVTEEDIASLFNVPVKRVEQWGNQTVLVIGKKGKTKFTVVKPGKRGLKGKTMTVAQYSTHVGRDRGLNVVSQMDQLIRWFSNDWVERTDKNMNTAQDLIDTASSWLSKKSAAAAQSS